MAALIFVPVAGISAQPGGTNWVYAVSRPLVSPDQTAFYRAWKYDGTVPWNAQQQVELGLYATRDNAQQACQVDYDNLSPVNITLDTTDGS
jgi:hypothetical protein